MSVHRSGINLAFESSFLRNKLKLNELWALEDNIAICVSKPDLYLIHDPILLLIKVINLKILLSFIINFFMTSINVSIGLIGKCKSLFLKHWSLMNYIGTALRAP